MVFATSGFYWYITVNCFWFETLRGQGQVVECQTIARGLPLCESRPTKSTYQRTPIGILTLVIVMKQSTLHGLLHHLCRQVVHALTPSHTHTLVPFSPLRPIHNTYFLHYILFYCSLISNRIYHGMETIGIAGRATSGDNNNDSNMVL